MTQFPKLHEKKHFIPDEKLTTVLTYHFYTHGLQSSLLENFYILLLFQKAYDTIYN